LAKGRVDEKILPTVTPIATLAKRQVAGRRKLFINYGFNPGILERKLTFFGGSIERLLIKHSFNH